VPTNSPISWKTTVVLEVVAGSSAFTHTAHGLVIRTPFPCHGLSPALPGILPDVEVTEASVPRHLATRSVGEADWDAAPGRFLLRGGRRSARFLVDSGRVTFERNRLADDAVLGRQFIHRVLGPLLHQSGFVVLHASAVLTPHGVVVIAGNSGAGKSTTVAALLQQGGLMASDDITALRIGANGPIEVPPGHLEMNLTEETAARLGLDTDSLQWQPRRRLKAAVPARDRMATSAGPLRAIFRLGVHDGKGIRTRALSGVARFEAVQSSLYGPVFPGDHVCPGRLARVATANVIELLRPMHQWSAPEVAASIVAAVSGQLP
jgi:hypothetical protein